MLIGDTFLQMLRNFRVCWIGGRYGGGKTALSIRVGYEFVARGWAEHILCNFPCVLSTDWRKLPDLWNCFIILDEAGIWMDAGEVEQVMAFLRKRNLFLVIPSVLPPPVRVRFLEVQRVMNWATIGLPIWQYEMRLDYMRVHEKMRLLWVRPQEVYGLWDTNHVAIDSEGITGYVRAVFGFSLPSGRRRTGLRDSTRGLLSSGAGDAVVEEVRRVAEQQYENAQKFDDAISVLKRASRGRRY